MKRLIRKSWFEDLKKTRTYTLTCGDRAENHKGMEIIGKKAAVGFTREDLEMQKARFEAAGYRCELIGLSDSVPAYVLVIRGGIEAIGGSAQSLFVEQTMLPKDEKAFMYGRVVNKKARHNLCFSKEGHGPDYEKGRGTVIAYEDVPVTKRLADGLVDWFGPKAADLQMEGNYYYDITKCGIGYHGDSERIKVIAARLGASMPLYFQCFLEGLPVGPRIGIPLHHGDMYVMSEKAVGTDWKNRKVHTFRHATGCAKFTKL
jgi:hypothetical protein